MFYLVGSLRIFRSITVNVTRIYEIHARTNFTPIRVSFFGNLDFRNSYEICTILDNLVKFADSARDIRTNFGRNCKIGTAFTT